MNANEKKEKLSKLLSIMLEASQKMPKDVFEYYVDSKSGKELKPLYNLFAESYLSIFSFCSLFFNCAWSQASAILRIAIEQISAAFVLVNNQHSIKEYVRINRLNRQYHCLDSDERKKDFIKNNYIKKPTEIFFDYGWVSSLTEDGSYGRDQIIHLAELDELLIDIKEELNAFSHGSLSIFDFHNKNEGWNLMERYGRRITLICCKLFDYLCCAYKEFIGDAFLLERINEYFIEFKPLYIEVNSNI